MNTLMLKPLHLHRKSPKYTLDKRLGRAQTWSGHSGEEKNSFPCQELNPIFKLVA
jgi:hypothetical protein